jgi:antitoxin component YwqK of YwqJK toxin-antitoxin module
MKNHTQYHKDGTIWAKGQMKDGQMHGYWEWYRKPTAKGKKIGTIMRAGSMKNGKQIGEWTTYDAKGKIVKVTSFDKK